MKIEVTQCSMCKHYSEEQYCEIWQQYIANDAFYCACGAKTDRKTENNSEKPNNCTDCEHWTDTEDGCADRHGCRATTEDCSTVPTSSKMEQVDEPQTERIKTPDYCDICNHKGCGNCIANNLDDYCVPSGYEPITQTETKNSNLSYFRLMDERKMDEKIAKRFTEDLQDWKDKMWSEAVVTEPQTELVRVKYHCINCAENGSFKCSKCDGEMYYKYDKDEPQK